MEYIYIVMRGEFIESDHNLQADVGSFHEDNSKKRQRKENDIIGIHHILEQQGVSVKTNAYTRDAPLSGCIPIKVEDIRNYVDGLPRQKKRETVQRLWEMIAQELVIVQSQSFKYISELAFKVEISEEER